MQVYMEVYIFFLKDDDETLYTALYDENIIVGVKNT
jgi:hypothetical protein